MDRRTFLARAGLVATWAGVPIVVGCGDGDGGTEPGTGDDVTGTVDPASGHTHGGAVVTAAQLGAGTAVTLTLTGSGHTHHVILSGAQVMDIAAGAQVIQTSEPDGTGHVHVVTFH